MCRKLSKVMISQLACLHISKKHTIVPIHWNEDVLTWSTCLRELRFFLNRGPASAVVIPEGAHLYVGVEAYRFVLQVICGLHSELLGETEVMGQFKNFMEAQVGSDSLTSVFQKFAQAVWSDAKKIRSEFLQDFGSQSYGSIARGWVRETSQIHVLGYGHLAQEMEPWLAKVSTPLTFHVRHPEKAQSNHPVQPLAAGGRVSGAVIVAAGLSDEDLIAWLTLHVEECLDVIVDLRDQSQPQQWAAFAKKTYCLKDAFDRVSQGSERRRERAIAALTAIDAKVSEQVSRQVVRPFGWDDLCA